MSMTKERIRSWIQIKWSLLVPCIQKARSKKITIWDVVEKLLKKWLNGEIELD